LVACPGLLDQAGLNACGPASAFYIWGQRDPAGFAQLAIDLFERGTGSFGSISVTAGSDLRTHGPSTYNWGTLPVPEEADWLLLSSLRDSENRVVDFEGGPGDTASGITMPGEIEDWLRAGVACSSVTEDTNLLTTKSLTHAQGLNAHLSAGKAIVLLISAEMIVGDLPGFVGWLQGLLPNHYVVLNSPIETIGGRVQFTCYTWGNPSHKIDVTEEDFEDNYYGSVIATC
jgi:hypothetical protein